MGAEVESCQRTSGDKPDFIVPCMRRQASGQSFAYVGIAELLDNGAGTHLVDMFRNKKVIFRSLSKLSPQRQEALDGCFFCRKF